MQDFLQIEDSVLMIANKYKPCFRFVEGVKILVRVGKIDHETSQRLIRLALIRDILCNTSDCVVSEEDIGILKEALEWSKSP